MGIPPAVSPEILLGVALRIPLGFVLEILLGVSSIISPGVPPEISLEDLLELHQEFL